MIVRKANDSDIEQTNGWGEWSKEPSVFPWVYDEKETCYILKGEASVQDGNGNIIEFKQGDWVEFEQGLECTWTITKTIHKKYLFGE